MNYHIYYNKTTGKKVQTITRATAVPSMQEVVCYQELYDEYDFFVMSREDFQNKFTRELDGLPSYSKKQIDKRVELPQKTKRIEAQEQPEEREENFEESVLTRFLDAHTFAERIEILRKAKEELDEKMLNNIAMCLDITIDNEGEPYEYIMKHLELQNKYEGSRLR